jgi:hypothetical protein
MKKRLLNIVSLLLLLAATASDQATAYSTPPSWNPMSMPGVTYNPATNMLKANPANNTTPGYYMLWTNTLASNGNPAPDIANFDPLAVWAVLNNTAFSRKIGWYDPNEGIAGQAILDQVRSVYGAGANIWIDCLSKSAGLNTYLAVGFFGVNADGSLTVDYANPTGVPYSPIFGTAGSSTKWLWDGVMDHNTNAVPFSYLTAPNQPFSADYRLYIGDAAGNELLVDKNGTPVASAATTTTWSWTGPPFVFTSQAGVAISTLVESDVFTATNPPDIPSFTTSDISISGGEYAISTDNGATWGSWTSAPGTIAKTNKVKVRQTSATSPGTTTTATLAIPAVIGPGTFSVTTVAADTTPDPFTFTPLIGAALNTITESAPVTVTGINNPAPISVSAGAYYAISGNNGASWGSWTSGSGTVSPNDQVKLQVVSATTPATETLATLTIGGVSGSFNVTTLAPDPAWPVRMGGFDLPSLAYAYSIAPFDAVIMIKDGILTTESSFSADRNITVTLWGGYNAGFSKIIGTTIIQGVSNVLTVKQGKVIVDKVYIRSTVPL